MLLSTPAPCSLLCPDPAALPPAPSLCPRPCPRTGRPLLICLPVRGRPRGGACWLWDAGPTPVRQRRAPDSRWRACGGAAGEPCGAELAAARCLFLGLASLGTTVHFKRLYCSQTDTRNGLATRELGGNKQNNPNSPLTPVVGNSALRRSSARLSSERVCYGFL